MATLTPSSPRRMAIAWPMPELPPVTIATLPCMPFIVCSSSATRSADRSSWLVVTVQSTGIAERYGFRLRGPSDFGFPALRLTDRPRGVDQPDVAERLWEVAEQLAGPGVHLLRQQPHVVGVRDRALEHRPGPIDPSGHGQRLRQPERAEQERALVTGEPVDALLGAVPVDQAAFVGQPFVDRLDG